MLILIIVLLLFGGIGGGWYGHQNYGPLGRRRHRPWHHPDHSSDRIPAGRLPINCAMIVGE